MEVVAVTGGCGVLGRHLIRKLLDDDQIAEVRVLDRRAIRPESHRKLKYFQIELSNEADVERALRDVDAVVHLAKADIPLKYQTKEEILKMWRDNVQVTEILVEKMMSGRVSRLVYVGDAFSSLPIDDNFGLSEDAHGKLPDRFLMGEYGESRARAELFARKTLERASSISALFLRPTWIYSEIRSSFWSGLVEMASEGQLPYIEDYRRGLHQFIYAGNLAALIRSSLSILKSTPSTVSNEIVYCTDDTTVSSFTKFLFDRIGKGKDSEDSFLTTYISHLYNHFLYKIGSKRMSKEKLHFHTYRTLFEKTVGFSDKKLRLLLKYRPEEDPSSAMSRTCEAFRNDEKTLHSERICPTPIEIEENKQFGANLEIQKGFTPSTVRRSARMG